MDIRFVVNLRAETTSDELVHSLRPRGWLVAPENVTGPVRQRLPSLLASGRWLFADNGNFALIGGVAESLAAQSRLLGKRARDERYGAHPRAAFPATLTKRLDELAARALRDARDTQLRRAKEKDGQETQLALNPTHLIGAEDIGPAVLLRLGLEPDWLPDALTQLARRNRSVARARRFGASGLAESVGPFYYPVATALDYDSARQAGRIFAHAGHRRVAMGFGAYMADDSYTRHYRAKRRVVELQARLPNRYLRTALVARGFFTGYAEEAGRLPDGFHFLGLGAPIMLAVVARAAYGVGELTFDAMSPIMDAAQATFYVNRPAYLKIRTWRVAERLARRGERWLCPCPFCHAFAEEHPFKYGAIQRVARASGSSFVVDDLRPLGRLYAIAPLLSEPSRGPFRRMVTAARIGHNHWVLEGICAELRRAARSEAGLDHRLDAIVESYASKTAGEHFASVVRLAASIARGDFGLG